MISGNMNAKLNVINIGVMSLQNIKERTIKIAKGQYKPSKDEPKIWFTSMKSLASVLSEDNQQLLKLIVEKHPQSVNELGSLTGRKSNNLLRTLRTMENYGLVKLLEGKQGKGKKALVPHVIYNKAAITINLKLSYFNFKLF